MNCVSPSGCISSLQSHQKAKAQPLLVPSVGLCRAVGFVAGAATGRGHACLLVRLAPAYTVERAVPPFLLLCFAGRGGLQPTAPQVPSPSPLSSCGLPQGHKRGCRARALCRSSRLPCSPDFFSFFHQSLGCPGWAESRDTGAEMCQQQEVSSAASCAAGATGGVGAALDKARGSELTSQQQGSATSGLLRKLLESST